MLDIIFLIGGLVLILLGANGLTDGAAAVAKRFQISDLVIGLTIVAFGTSLPELITSITAAKRGNSDIAMGNIIGSNIFNILFVVGLTAVITPVPFAGQFVIDTIFTVAAVVYLLICVFKDRTLGRTGGVVMLIGYAIYFVYLLFR